MPNQNEQLEAEANSASREQSSKLTIKIEPDSNGFPNFVIRDDRGYRLPGIRNLSIDAPFRDAVTVTVQFVIDRRNVTLDHDLKNNR
ncbi:MAG: hypothetical protein KIT65_10895 [Xanthobacteraceae bacterium]|nr:hypothetical protein [Xanthobacteraceae bacterium]